MKSAIGVEAPVVGKTSGALHVPEGGDEAVADLRRHVLLADPADGLDRHADLLDVVGAAVAERDVVLEARDFRGRERAFEVVGDELDHLLPAAVLHRITHCRCCSSAARTFERARCNRTRWLPSLTSSASQTSSALQPSTSRMRITARCSAEEV